MLSIGLGALVLILISYFFQLIDSMKFQRILHKNLIYQKFTNWAYSCQYDVVQLFALKIYLSA